MHGENIPFSIEKSNPEDALQIVRKIGQGSYGTVVLCQYRSGDEENNISKVAVKLIPMAGDEEMNKVVNEITFLQSWYHPNIVRYHPTYRSLTELWLEMEYCEGGSVEGLFNRLQRPLPEPVIRYICREKHNVFFT